MHFLAFCDAETTEIYARWSNLVIEILLNEELFIVTANYRHAVLFDL